MIKEAIAKIVNKGDLTYDEAYTVMNEMYIGGKADTMAQGISLAAQLIDSGKAMETLNRFIEVSNRPEVDA